MKKLRTNILGLVCFLMSMCTVPAETKEIVINSFDSSIVNDNTIQIQENAFPGQKWQGNNIVISNHLKNNKLRIKIFYNEDFFLKII